MLIGEPRVVPVPERGKCFFPRNELVAHSGHSLILPETRELKALEFKDVADGVNLFALGLIGLLPLTSTITLNIIPKFPIENLWTMLETGGETYERIIPTIRRYQVTETAAPTMLLARSFCHYLRNLLTAGLERSYYVRSVNGFYKPRVEFGQTIGRYLSRGNPIETVSSVYEFGLNSKINRIVKSACLRFSKITPHTKAWENDRRLIQVALETLSRVDECEPSGQDFFLDEMVSGRLREHYSGLLRIYQLLLTGGGIAFTFEPNGQKLPSFLFDLEDIFERFIRQTFTDALKVHNITVLDGNKHQGRLFSDSKVYPTKPDIIFRDVKRAVICIGEVKYKPKIKEADRYQIISHVTAEKAPLGILFSPANEGESQRLERIGRMATGAEFYHYRFDIAGDIRLSQAQMVRDIRALLPEI